MAYSPVFHDHLDNPRNVGQLDDATVTGEETNPVCGDRMRLSLRIRDQEIETARYLAYGCAPTLVCGSILTEMIEGKTIDAALQVTRNDLVDFVGGLPSRKQHAAALAIETLRSELTKAGPRASRTK